VDARRKSAPATCWAHSPARPGFTREQVGKITVTDRHTYVAVVRDIARDAVRKLAAGKVKGRTVKVRALGN
jgi:ATP-independent RNA helicase DbpA